MKKVLLLISVIFIIALTGCSKGSISDTAIPADIANAIVTDAGIDKATLEVPDKAATSIILADIPANKISSSYILKSATSTSVDEIGVIKASDAKDTKDIEKSLKTYLADRLTSGELLKDYLPEEFPKLENAKIEIKGNYVVYTILNTKASSAVTQAFAAAVKK